MDGVERVDPGPRPKRESMALRSKHNDLVRGGQATRRDGSLGRKVNAVTRAADTTVEQLRSMTARQRRHTLRKHHELMRPWRIYRASLPAHSSKPSQVSALTQSEGRAADFREKIDGCHEMDPHFVQGLTRQLPMVEKALPLAAWLESKGMKPKVRVTVLRRNGVIL